MDHEEKISDYRRWIMKECHYCFKEVEKPCESLDDIVKASKENELCKETLDILRRSVIID